MPSGPDFVYNGCRVFPPRREVCMTSDRHVVFVVGRSTDGIESASGAAGRAPAVASATRNPG